MQTKEEFIVSYCTQYGISREVFHATQITLLCDCDDECCTGWVAIDRDSQEYRDLSKLLTAHGLVAELDSL